MIWMLLGFLFLAAFAYLANNEQKEVLHRIEDRLKKIEEKVNQMD